MIEQTISETSTTRPQTGRAYLCLYGHFYQPPRENPFTGILPIESEAAPFANYNEKITVECYRPNAEMGNFAAISYDLGPTLASWLENAHPDVYQQILAADYHHRMRYGVGNALAQAYNHTILPLANSRDKLTQILWGLSDELSGTIAQAVEADVEVSAPQTSQAATPAKSEMPNLLQARLPHQRRVRMPRRRLSNKTSMVRFSPLRSLSLVGKRE